MKDFEIILFTFISVLLLSCNKGGLVDETNSNSYFYSSDKSKILYKQPGGPGISQLWDYEWLEVPADAKTFKVMKGGFGKDAKNIFSGIEIIDYVDYNTFHRLDEGNYMDNKNVYTRSIKIIKDANPKTYQIIKSIPEYYSNKPTYKWAKDDKHYFYEDSIVQVDYNSFEILTTDFMVDKDFIYCRDYDKFYKYPNKNEINTKFTVLSYFMVYSPKYFYTKNFPSDSIKGISVVSIKNAKSIKKFGYGNYFTIDGLVYYEMLKIENADPNTFDTFIKVRGEQMAKDKNHFYLRNQIVANVNPKEVIYNAEKDEFTYRGKFWNYETEKFDKENSR